MFKKIQIQGWRQFEEIEINFHENLTVITGANGAGKTTILNLLNRHFGWNLNFVATPRQKKKGVLKFLSDLWDDPLLSKSIGKVPSNEQDIGRIEYSNANFSSLGVPKEVGQSYNVSIHRQQNVNGVFVSSHRPLYVYKKLESIPTTVDAKDQLFSKYLNDLRARYSINSRTISPSFRLKEALVSLATFGYGNNAVEPNQDAVATYEGFEQALRLVLPKSLGFQEFKVRLPEIVLVTESGEFSFDAVSGGIASLLDLTWQIFMASQIHESFVVIMDEPENHLHPELQRSLLPNLIKAFPQAQYICATHNPFIVTSVPDSNVYVLDYNERQRVETTKLDLIDKAGSSNTILRDVLGLKMTIPIWAEERINQIVDQHSNLEFTAENAQRIRTQMSQLGMEDLFPEVITRVLGGSR